MKLDERFWSKVDKTDDCWIWTSATNPQGRAQYWYEGKYHIASRLVSEWLFGPIPPKMLMCHTCDNLACVNPKHLFLGFHLANMADRNRKGRQIKGMTHPNRKLSIDQVKEIRESTVSSTILAQQYGVVKSTICRIRKGNAWVAA
jgi:hypothetical protein